MCCFYQPYRYKTVSHLYDTSCIEYMRASQTANSVVSEGTAGKHEILSSNTDLAINLLLFCQKRGLVQNILHNAIFNRLCLTCVEYVYQAIIN